MRCSLIVACMEFTIKHQMRHGRLISFFLFVTAVFSFLFVVFKTCSVVMVQMEQGVDAAEIKMEEA